MTESEKYSEVHRIVGSVMVKQDAATYNGEASKGMDIVLDKATRDILSLFGEK